MFDVSLLSAFFGGILVFSLLVSFQSFHFISVMAGVGMASLNEEGQLPDDIRRKASYHL